ncbi:transposase family protein, partial [Streptomyces sp. NPDC004752]
MNPPSRNDCLRGSHVSKRGLSEQCWKISSGRRDHSGGRADGKSLAGATSPASAAACATNTYTRQFFANTGFSGEAKRTDCDAAIGENWGTEAPGVTGLGKDNFGVRWSVQRDFGSGGPFTFTASGQDGIRVYLDGVRKIDLWKNGTTTVSKTVTLTIPRGTHVLDVRGAARVGRVVTLAWARAACSHPALSGISRAHFGELLEEIAPRWEAARESALRERRGGERRRAAGAGPRQRLVFIDRLLVILVHLRLGLPHAALAQLYGVDRSTVSGAVREVRSLLAARGFAVPDRPGPRIRTLEDLFAYAGAEGVKLRLDGTEVQVRRPRAGRPGRKTFVSGKNEAEHRQDHHLQRRSGPHPVQRGGAAKPDARPECDTKAHAASGCAERRPTDVGGVIPG